MGKMEAKFLVFAITLSITQVFSQLLDLNECGVSFGCFRKPDNCTLITNCQSFVSYTFNSTTQMIEFHLVGKRNWVAFGQKLEGDEGTLMERLRGQYCVRNRNGEPIFGSFERNDGNGNGPPNWSGAVPVPNVTALETRNNPDGTFSCRFKRPVTINTPNIYLYNMSATLTVALSDGTNLNGDNPGRHGLKDYRAASISFTTLGNPTVVTPTLQTDPDGCGVTIGCFRKPSNCIPLASCESYVTYMFNSTTQTIEFHLVGNVGNQVWVALGQKMLDDDEGTLMERLRGQYCVRDPNGGVPILGSFERNNGNGNGPPNWSGLDVVPNVTLIETRSSPNGNFSCRYERPVTVNVDNIYHYDMDVILTGVLSDGTSLNGINPTQHAFNNYISAAINFLSLDNPDAQGIPLTPRVKAHGILMIISWMLFATFGIFMARYMKTALKEQKICGKAAWFPIHQMTMLLCVTTFVAGLILILVELEGKWAAQAGTHHWLGLFTVIAGLIQPVMAAFRPDPKADKRFIFNWMHRFVGFLAWVLGAVAIIYGLYITVGDEYIPALAFVIAVPAMGLILDIVIIIEDFIGSDSKADAAVTYEGSRQEVQGVQKSDSKGKGSSFQWCFLVLIVALAIAMTGYHIYVVANGERPSA